MNRIPIPIRCIQAAFERLPQQPASTLFHVDLDQLFAPLAMKAQWKRDGFCPKLTFCWHDESRQWVLDTNGLAIVADGQ